MPKGWLPRQVIEIPFEPRQKNLYFRGDPACKYPQWPRKIGRARGSGEFALVLARDYFLKRGYNVWVSEPTMNGENGWRGFIAVSFPGYRDGDHAAYRRMIRKFGRRGLRELNVTADALKKKQTGTRGGGDPDLFVFRGDGKTVRFFVEAKYKDHINRNQKLTFPLIESRFGNWPGCAIKLAQLIESLKR